MHRLRLFCVFALFGITFACDDSGSRRVGDPCTRTEECSDGICGQGECLPPHTIELPEAPILIEITPPSPSNDPSPILIGQAYPGESVSIYQDEDCREKLAEVEADKGGRFSAKVDIEKDSTQTFYLQSRAGTLKSRCAATSFQYTHSSRKPADPSLTEIIPPSPAPVTEPYFLGETDPLAHVSFSDVPDCAEPIHTVQANGDGLFAVQITVPEGQQYTIYAQATSVAGNHSACTAFATYEHAWEAPLSPWLSPEQRTDIPLASASPVQARFCAALNAETHLYTDETCEGDPLPATPTDDPSCSDAKAYEAEILGDIWAQSTSDQGVLSPCVQLFSVAHETTPPANPTLLDALPPSPSESTEPYLIGQTSPLADVSLSLAEDCSAPFAELQAGAEGRFVTQLEVPEEQRLTVYAEARSPAGTVSDCVLLTTYEHVWHPPAPPWLSEAQRTALPSASAEPVTTNFCAPAGSQVTLYDAAGCSGTGLPFHATVDPSCEDGDAFEATVIGQIWAQSQTDKGTLSPCVPLLSVSHVTESPDPPTFVEALPPSPSATTQPYIIGQTAAFAEVIISNNAQCSYVLATTQAGGEGLFVAEITIPASQNTQLYAKSISTLGNGSACAPLTAYEHNWAPPTAPWQTYEQRAELPLASATPIEVRYCGAAEAETHIYDNASCSGGLISSTKVSDSRCEGAQGYQANLIGDFWGQSTSPQGATSPCVKLHAASESTEAPTPPTLVDALPPSPSDSTTPLLIGTTSADVLVELSSDSQCQNKLGESRSSDEGRFVFVVEALEGGQRSFYARATSDAGNQSDCVLFAQYTHAWPAPKAPWQSYEHRAETPAQANAPVSTRFCVGQGDTAAAYHNSQCNGPALSIDAVNDPRCADGDAYEVTLNDDLWVRSSSPHGIESPCTKLVAFELSTQNPGAPTFIEALPPSPSPVLTPYILGSAEPNTTVVLSTHNRCNTTLQTVSTSAEGHFLAEVTVPANGTLTLYAKAISSLGNESPCALLTSYTHAWRPPSPPWQSHEQWGNTPELSADPVWVSFCGEAGATTQFYEDQSCLGTPISATTFTAPDCDGGQGYRASILGDVYGQSTSPEGAQSACVHLATVTALPPPDEIAIHSIRADNWVLDNGDVIESEFLVGGYTRPDAVLILVSDGVLIGNGVASNTGRFEIRTSPLQTPTSGDLVAQIIAGEDLETPFAYRETLLVGPLDFYTVYGSEGIPHLDYLVHLPDESVLHRAAFDSHGRARLQLVAGMGLSVFYSDKESPFAEGGGWLWIDTVMDLTPGEPIVWDYKAEHLTRCELGLCALGETPLPPPPPVNFFIPMPPPETMLISIASSCGDFDEIDVGEIVSWPHVHTVQLSSHCIREEPGIRLIATALDDADSLLAYTEYSSTHRSEHLLDSWIPASIYFSTERTYTLYNDTDSFLEVGFGTFPVLFAHEYGDIVSASGTATFTGGPLAPADTLSLTGYGDLTEAHPAVLFEMIQEHGTLEVERAAYDFRPHSGHTDIYLTDLMQLSPVLYESEDEAVIFTALSGDTYDHAHLASHLSDWDVCVPCRNAEECDPCLEGGHCPESYCVSVIWDRSRNTWGDIAFNSDPEILRSILPAPLQPLADFYYEWSGGLAIFRFEGAPLWIELLRTVGYGVITQDSNATFSRWFTAFPELRMELLALDLIPPAPSN